jgi:hypothetical protein
VNHNIRFEWLRYILRVSEKSKDQCTLVSDKIGYGRVIVSTSRKRNGARYHVAKRDDLRFFVDKAHEQEIDVPLLKIMRN